VAVAITWQWQWLDGSEWVRSKGFLKGFRMVLKSSNMADFWLSYGYFMANSGSGKKKKSGSGKKKKTVAVGQKKWPKKTAIPTVFDTFICHFRCNFDAFSAISHSFFTNFAPFYPF
jgi:hypothetical protein